MKLFPLMVVAVALSGISCERQEFEGKDGTKQLHEHHSGDAHGHEEGDDHAH
jgi:hypothetical protein